MDFAGTFCEIAGIDAPSDLHGRSMAPILKEKTPKDWRKSFYYHYYEYPDTTGSADITEWRTVATS